MSVTEKEEEKVEKERKHWSAGLFPQMPTNCQGLARMEPGDRNSIQMIRMSPRCGRDQLPG